ncbi:hypothetical protein [Bradyrhizobium sp. WYCCWR 12699]|uniref:hypothetical protein n=1 Tax=Bradyrhizobium sp. WYCCWR 12699 TaxID=3064203 RepID=UPI0028A4AAD0|nr:hypothetical protein [Bradyrhizobium sp. WYCCWR 12699]MDT4739253.1 hypothetical protein [Bradyrhizobium sp. WYCCWR 12699]
MADILKRTWLSAAERDRRIVSSVLSDQQLAQIDEAAAEADALLLRLRGRTVDSAKQRPSAPCCDLVRQR